MNYLGVKIETAYNRQADEWTALTHDLVDPLTLARPLKRTARREYDAIEYLKSELDDIDETYGIEAYR